MVTLLGTLLQPPQGGSIFGGMFLADGYAAFFKVLFLIAAALTVLISLRYLDDEGIQRGEYYALVLFATVGMMFMAGGGDFITIYLGLELMSLSTYVLVGFIRRDGTSTEGAVKYFLMGAFTSGILLYGLALLYGLTGSTNLAAVAQSLSGLSLDNPALVLATILVVVGFGFKIAAVPFHMWAPDTYEGAPTSITAFMSSAVKAAALAGLARVFVIALFPSAEIWEVLWWILAALSMILGNVVAIAQTSLKRMLAYSSISHAGYALIGVVAATQAREVGLAGALFYMFVYLFATMGTFSMVILLTHRGFPQRPHRRLRRPRPHRPAGGLRLHHLLPVPGGHPAHRRLRRQAGRLPRRHRVRLYRPRRHRRRHQRHRRLLLLHGHQDDVHGGSGGAAPALPLPPPRHRPRRHGRRHRAARPVSLPSFSMR